MTTTLGPLTTRRQRTPVGIGRTGDGFICNLLPSTGTATDFNVEDALSAEIMTAAPLPQSVDLREPWWKIGTQEQTGSCVGWATADGVGRWTMVKAGRLKQTRRLSPRFIWMSSKERDEFGDRPTSFAEISGTSLKAAARVASKYGFALESQLPFHIRTTMYGGNENALFASCAKRRVTYVNLNRRLAHWKSWLAQNGPILAGLMVDAQWEMYDGHDVLDAYDTDAIYGGHAVCIVGYREDGTFIVRNSWGTSWGDQGFGYVTPDYIRAAFYPESYGMVAA